MNSCFICTTSAIASGRLSNAPDTDPVEFERGCHDEAWGCAYYRIVYAIDDTQSIVEIRVIRHRKDAYGPT
jgi:hypothetical protein